jgi:hypothetical protein
MARVAAKVEQRGDLDAVYGVFYFRSVLQDIQRSKQGNYL